MPEPASSPASPESGSPPERGPERPPLPGDHEGGPLDAFVHDIDFTRFDTRVGRLLPVLLAGAVGIVAAWRGIPAGVATAVVIAVGLAAVTVPYERARWRAQDVLHWYYAGRGRRWLADTGRLVPSSDVASAEVWLGAHQPGTVPQIYRVIAAAWTGDERRYRTELDALSEATPLDRITRRWVVEFNIWAATGDADTADIEALVGELPDGDDRSHFRSWLALVESSRRWKDRAADWLDPLVGVWHAARRERLGLKRSARLWFSRFIVVPVFLVEALFVGSLAVSIAGAGEPIPPEYARTTYGIRGDLPRFDDQAVARTLPALGRAVAGASRVRPGPLDVDTYNALIDASTPTLMWTTGEIELAPPSDLRGHRIWSTEVLLGGLGEATSAAIVIVDDEDGPAYLYRIDPAAFRKLREAAGLPVADSLP